MITEKVIIESLSEVINKKNKVIVIYSGLWTFINKIKFNNTNIAKTILNLIEKFIGEDRTLIIPSFSSECFLKNKKLGFIINAQCDAVKNIFKLKKIPFRQITFNKKNEEELGEFFTFFVLETILLSRLMNINPFDQPAVEQVKIETKKILR